MQVVGEHKFKTKKELETFTRGFLKNRLNTSIEFSDEGYGFLSSLIERHPDYGRKVSPPIKGFKVLKNFGGHIALNFTDSEEEKSVSWRKCVSQGRANWLADLKAVCRQEVTSQVQSFKDENYYDGMSCPSCMKAIPNRKMAHVDHKTKSFKQIFDEFTGSNFKKLPKDFKPAGMHIGYEFKDEDWYTRKIWVDYHREQADYQILCASCNIRKK